MEYLNLDYHIKRLLLIAVTRYKTKDEQAEALGITRRTLYNYCKKYKLQNSKKYESKNNTTT